MLDYYLLSEREWLDRIKAGNNHIETFILRKYEPPLRKAIKKKLGDYQFRGQEAEDFCQDIILRFLIRAREKGSNLLKTGQTIEHWFKGNVTNESLQAWRNQRRAKEILADYRDEEVVREIHKKMSQTDDFTIDPEIIDQALDRLGKEESKNFPKGFVKQLYTYRFAHCMTWKEVAEALNGDFPDCEKFSIKKPLTWEYVSRGLWNGNYDVRLRALLKSIRD